MRKLFNKFKNKLQDYWHDAYYKVTPQAGEEFAMTCKAAVEQMNFNEATSLTSRARLKLHLSLCKACAYYNKVSKALKKAVQEMTNKSSKVAIDVEKLNQELLNRYAITKGRSGK